MANMMKAAVFEKIGVIKVKEVPVPEIGENDVLIKVKNTGICGTDWSIYNGWYSADKLPMIAGHEFSGIVAKVGKNVKGVSEGDRVTCDINMSCGKCFYCIKGEKLLCDSFTQLGIHTDGTFAEYVKAPAALLHKLPDNMSFEEGAFIEPVSCVIHAAKAMDACLGSSVAIIGCGLGVLHARMAVLRACAPVIIFGDNRKRLRIAKDMGADYAIHIDDVADPVAEVMKLTHGRGADYAIEAVGTVKTYEQAFAMLRRGGRLSSFGITGEQDVMNIRPFEFVLGEKKITGSCAGVGSDWPDAITLISNGRINPKPLFSMKVPLEDLEWALHELRKDPSLFKIFVSPEVSKREVL
ncbi:MAG: alcohol dehydrogenase [Chloroflexi bacterium RBG_19FT_COMBO_49_13]|nr:MAG: alcohol dehydrogenase [Chloroflexi bacterium RBG_13_50_21]OGO62290.1 MAG: alcohol dehydrogenase [Chloroflexi bacterium RBG_19FT_COMBO_49_13]